MNYSFSGRLWKYPGDSAWHFITLPKKYTNELKLMQDPYAKNFGSIRVEATIGGSTWNTSIFPDNKTAAFLLPIKKEVRLQNNLSYDSDVEVKLTVVEKI